MHRRIVHRTSYFVPRTLYSLKRVRGEMGTRRVNCKERISERGTSEYKQTGQEGGGSYEVEREN